MDLIFGPLAATLITNRLLFRKKMLKCVFLECLVLLGALLTEGSFFDYAVPNTAWGCFVKTVSIELRIDQNEQW